MLFKKLPNKVKKSGFTLIEMMITLTISISLVMFGTVYLKKYDEKLILDNTAREVKSSIEQAARISTIEHEPTLISFYPESKYLSIKRSHDYRKIKINSQIEIYNLANFKISAKGSMAPHTVVITNHHETRRIRLQMMWGRAINGKD
ncbi:type II secretion system protein [Lactobacillus panisapium]|uniref:type II secretion system protein n=1 Tax=Lactobacillus panisapium TaxID=2012495 RepID=UPI000CDB5BE5|nr:type II secretion system protein [Lactobacillus panisapium]